jgi:hypothetical protein
MTQTDWLDGDALPVVTDKADIPESDVQEKCVEHARHHDAWARKFSSPQNRSVPDYIFCWNGLQWFVEFKRWGKKPTKQQYEEHAAIREAGGAVWVCDDVDDFKLRFADVRNVGDVFERESDYPEGTFG